MTPILGALLVFVMRVTDMSLDTLRMLFTVRGRKWIAAGIGVVQATVFIVAVSQVLKGPLTVGNVLGYAFGFGTGVVLGMFVEERLAIGYTMVRIYSPQCGGEIAAALPRRRLHGDRNHGLGSRRRVPSYQLRRNAPRCPDSSFPDRQDRRACVHHGRSSATVAARIFPDNNIPPLVWPRYSLDLRSSAHETPSSLYAACSRFTCFLCQSHASTRQH